MIGTHEVSETHAREGAFVQPDFVEAITAAHERAGFDRVLVGYGASIAEGTQVAAYAAAHSERLGFLLAHRPGVVFPTLAARTFATLDQFSRGRVDVHIVTGGVDADQRREGDYADKERRYARTASTCRCCAGAGRPTSRSTTTATTTGSRASAATYGPGGRRHPGLLRRVLGRGVPGRRPALSDTFMLWGEPLAETAEQIASVTRRRGGGRPGRAAAVLGARSGRSWAPPRTRPGPGHTRSSTRSRPVTAGSARSCPTPHWSVPRTRDRKASPHSVCSTPRPRASCTTGRSGPRRRRPPTRPATRPPWSAPGDTVAKALADYAELGVDTFLLRGYEPLQDSIDYGEQIIPQARAEIGRRAAARADTVQR